ncbi:antitoxin, partial [Rubrivivax gelatinosus]|uniref:Antitoxin n=1 Tax=Rubrivivax gelatinosus TaxID=28068 RepID=A0ABS1DQ50_RUBGE
MSKYPAHFEPDPAGGYVVTFRDIPEAITQGETLEEAREAAADALLTAMDFYFEDQRPVPAPSQAQDGEELVELPLSAVAKVALLNELCKQRVRPTDLAHAMGVQKQEVTRILDLAHVTKIDTIGRALKAIGKELELVVH